MKLHLYQVVSYDNKYEKKKMIGKFSSLAENDNVAMIDEVDFKTKIENSKLLGRTLR